MPQAGTVPASGTKRRKLVHYIGPNNRNYFNDWVFGLTDRRAMGRIFNRLGRIKWDGNFGDHEWVGDGVGELRIDYGPGYRVYFGLEGEEVVILLAGGDKGTQAKDIKTAKARWKERNARVHAATRGSSR